MQSFFSLPSFAVVVALSVMEQHSLSFWSHFVNIINDLDGGIEPASVMKRSRLRKQQGLLALTRSAEDYCPMACSALVMEVSDI